MPTVLPAAGNFFPSAKGRLKVLHPLIPGSIHLEVERLMWFARQALFLIISAVVTISLPAVAQAPLPPPFSPPGTVGVRIIPLLAATTTVTGQAIEFPRFRNEVLVVLTEIDPGGQTGPLERRLPGVDYVIEGTATYEFGGQTRVVTAGQTFVSPLNTILNGLNRGTVPLKLLVITAGEKGRPGLVRPAGSAPVSIRSSPIILQTTTTFTGELILFPLFKNQLQAVLAEYAPGGGGSHRHPVPVVFYVLEGAITFEPEGHAAKTFSAGQAGVETNASHGAFNRGTVPAKFFSVIMAEEGAPTIIR